MEKNLTIGDDEKKVVKEWFEELRNIICEEFEKIEMLQNSDKLCKKPPGKFKRKQTFRKSKNGEDGGGGIMSVMRDGRVFEKVGVNISTVYGTLEPLAQKSLSSRHNIPGLKEDPQFWASGISLVAHMQSPKTPAVHMNTRMFWTKSMSWFGGGSDLNPMVENEEDTRYFHNELKKVCDIADKDYYPKFKKWADEYFMIKHWNEARGVGGIFFDDLNTENWENDFNFVKNVGKAFLEAFSKITKSHMKKTWSPEEREWQLIKRGRYAEFNLLYDRGTKFGLNSGGNPEAILMSMPPTAKWK